DALGLDFHFRGNGNPGGRFGLFEHLPRDQLAAVPARFQYGAAVLAEQSADAQGDDRRRFRTRRKAGKGGFGPRLPADDSPGGRPSASVAITASAVGPSGKAGWASSSNVPSFHC